MEMCADVPEEPAAAITQTVGFSKTSSTSRIHGIISQKTVMFAKD